MRLMGLCGGRAPGRVLSQSNGQIALEGGFSFGLGLGDGDGGWGWGDGGGHTHEVGYGGFVTAENPFFGPGGEEDGFDGVKESVDVRKSLYLCVCVCA